MVDDNLCPYCSGEAIEPEKIKVDWEFYKIFDSSRLMFEIGPGKDGILLFRQNVDDISLGDRRFAQVRLLVDSKWILKGMAIYDVSDFIPHGYDVLCYIDPYRSSQPYLKDVNMYEGIKLHLDNKGPCVNILTFDNVQVNKEENKNA